MRAWVNGSILDDPTNPALTVLDHGLTVGDGVFEAVKVLDGQPFALTRHLDRMTRSAQGMGLPEPDHDEVRRAIGAVLEGQDLPLGRLRITFTGGVGPLGSNRSDAPPTLVVIGQPFTPYEPTTAAMTVRWTRNEHGVMAGIKTTSYAENVVALAEAHRQGATEAIFANTAGRLCEGTGSNVFYVVEGELRTPTLASGCLAGITRGLLLEWLDVRELDEPVGVLESADEIFLTSSFRDVQGVERCDTRELAAPGPVTTEAMRIWARNERADLDP